MYIKVKINENFFMTEDFKKWIFQHKEEKFKVKSETIGNDGKEVYILYKVPFRISKCFTEEIK